MLRTLSLVFALATFAALPSQVMAHGYYGWRGPAWRHAWGYAGPGWHRGYVRPYGYAYGDDFYGGGCWRWIDGARVWVC